MLLCVRFRHSYLLFFLEIIAEELFGSINKVSHTIQVSASRVDMVHMQIQTRCRAVEI